MNSVKIDIETKDFDAMLDLAKCLEETTKGLKITKKLDSSGTQGYTRSYVCIETRQQENKMPQEKYIFGNFHISQDSITALCNWVDHGTQPNSFLEAVISNNLKGVITYGDDESIANLPAYVAWLFNMAPQSCWGSFKAYNTWVTLHKSRS